MHLLGFLGWLMGLEPTTTGITTLFAQKPT